jgi:hypothetical protein
MEALTAFSSATKSGAQIAGLGGGDSHAELRGEAANKWWITKQGILAHKNIIMVRTGRKTQDGRP